MLLACAYLLVAFCALMPLIGHWEEHPVCKRLHGDVGMVVCLERDASDLYRSS